MIGNVAGRASEKKGFENTGHQISWEKGQRQDCLIRGFHLSQAATF
jgi:hypothetical protein